MRKVTGYIGALIVVVALMGSILAGYALNINGQSTVVNEYENVTDVSGLYSHTDQKTYIDYNPASNYIGYSAEQSSPFTINNPNGLTSGVKYKIYTTSATGRWSDDQYSDGAYYGTDGNTVANSTSGLNTSVPAYRVANGENFTAYRWMGGGAGAELELRINNNGTIERYWAYDFDFSFNGSTVTITFNGQTKTTPSSWYMAPAADGDYVCVYGAAGYYQTGQLYKTFESNSVSTQINEWDGKPTFNFYSVTTTNADAFVPAVFTYRPVDIGNGIDYTESNRVNNYIIGYRDIGGTPVTTSSRIDLQNVSTYNYATPNKSWVMDDGWTDFDEHYNPIWDWQLKAPPTYTVYKFTDLLTSLSVPANTINVTLKIPMVMAGDWYASPLLRTIWDWPDGSDGVMVSSMPYNLVMIGNNAGTYDYKVSDAQYSINGTISNNNLFRTASYDVSSGLVNIYDYNGTKILTDSVNNIYIQYLKNPNTSGYVDSINRNTAAHVTDTYTINYRTNTPSYQTISPISVMDVDITTSTSTSVPIYMDITKGIKIDPANASNTIWNNEYENGTVKLLFRAEDTYGTYHNEFSVSDNTISVDYTGSRFFISLNGAEQIDVGIWRSIILNIDMLNGEVFVNPVRTFNSYTNVSTDKATIFIGDTINNTPITSISWKPTPNSFTFNVYATDVFLNTYGVVMVNPSLTITNYFTDLNNFYRLVLNNFSTYGDSITVNGVTGNVSGNTITFNDETITLKNLEIIYADGHVYVEDDNDSVDLGTIANNDISLSGVWYFETDLDRGYTTTKQIYTWDWTDFILDNTQFCIFYIGMALVGLVVARRFCIMSVIDYAVFITSIIIALSTQVIA